MEEKKLTKHDIWITIVLAVLIGMVSCSVLGFFAEGMDAPIRYNGGDDFEMIYQVKQLTEETWLWSTDKLGAPFGQKVYDYSYCFLQNTEYFLIKVISFFTKNVPFIVNLIFMLTFVFCGVFSYLMLRKMGIKYLLAACGALLFAFSPYILMRGISHFCIAVCYFVPISVYFCYRSYMDENFLKFDRSLFSFKTLLVLAGCVCIANNGIGYYPFFTCFLLCVTALCKFLDTKKIKTIIPMVKLVVCISAFMFISLLPTFIYHAKNGSYTAAIRNLTGVEVYGLKPAQFFVPLYGHNIGWVGEFVTKYNDNMPLVNENKSSYLGVLACLGLLWGLICIFKKDKESDTEIFFFGRLNLASILMMSVGGFISILAVATNMDFMRGFNRISIFVEFCCITILCFGTQRLLDGMSKKTGKCLAMGLIVALTIFGLWDQTPSLYSDGVELRMSRENWASDEAFVQEIEALLQPNDMVFQLPYHKFPEGGKVNKMGDYALFTGYIHSNDIRWSYGAVRGREADAWNETIAGLEIPDMIDSIIQAGFRGIYIDRRAYSDEEFEGLVAEIEAKTGTEYIESKNGNLVFFIL